jgi:hypothetical protein
MAVNTEDLPVAIRLLATPAQRDYVVNFQIQTTPALPTLSAIPHKNTLPDPSMLPAPYPVNRH